jgi:outer membrane protein assembly factor BamE (lipoprotein component of BamABCDE complex)
MLKQLLPKILIGILVVTAAVITLYFVDFTPAEPTVISETVKNYTIEDLSILDMITHKKISIGMSKEQVEQALGLPSATNKREYSELLEYDYSGLYVIYRNDKVVNLRVNKYTSKEYFRFLTDRNLGIDDKAEDVLSKYNNINSNEAWMGCALYNGESGIQVIDEKNAGQYNPEKVYLVYFAKSINDKIYLFTIMDYKNRITFN